MSLNNIHFILVRHQMGENIGSVARAIKNFQIKKLRIINEFFIRKMLKKLKAKYYCTMR